MLFKENFLYTKNPLITAYLSLNLPKHLLVCI